MAVEGLESEADQATPFRRALHPNFSSALQNRQRPCPWRNYFSGRGTAARL